MTEVTIASALGISVLGFSIVFIVLVLLMAIIKVMSAIIGMTTKKNMKNENVQAAVTAPTGPAAKGSCGDLTLVKVSERDAAMIMAIVADQLKTPINELRFISIKEVE